MVKIIERAANVEPGTTITKGGNHKNVIFSNGPKIDSDLSNMLS